VLAHDCLLPTDVPEWAHAPCRGRGSCEDRCRLRGTWALGSQDAYTPHFPELPENNGEGPPVEGDMALNSIPANILNF
jgi:hypothetical protein